MLEAQLAKIKLEKENQRIAEKLKSTSSRQVVGLALENSAVVSATGQEEAAAKAVLESVPSTSLVSVVFLFNLIGKDQPNIQCQPSKLHVSLK